LQGNIMVDNSDVQTAFSNIRALNATAIFGKVAVTTPIPDRLNMAIRQWQRNGGLGELFLNSIYSIPKGINDIGEYIWKGIDFKRKGGLNAEEREWIRNQGIIANGLLSGIKRNYDDINRLGSGKGFIKVVDGIQKVFGKVSFLEAKQNIDDIADFIRLSSEMAGYLKQNYNSLNASQREVLASYGLTQKEFDVLKQIPLRKDFVTGKTLLSPNDVKSLTNEQLKPLIGSKQQLLDAFSLLEKNEKYKRLSELEEANAVKTGIIAEGRKQIQNKIDELEFQLKETEAKFKEDNSKKHKQKYKQTFTALQNHKIEVIKDKIKFEKNKLKNEDLPFLNKEDYIKLEEANKKIREYESIITSLNSKPKTLDEKIAINQIRFDLENKVRSYYANEAIAQRGYKTERANIITRNIKGTLGKEIAKTTLVAKTYPLMYWENIITSTFDSFSKSGNQKWAAFATFASASILAGFVVEQTNEMLKGRQPKAFDKQMMARVDKIRYIRALRRRRISDRITYIRCF